MPVSRVLALLPVVALGAAAATGAVLATAEPTTGANPVVASLSVGPRTSPAVARCNPDSDAVFSAARARRGASADEPDVTRGAGLDAYRAVTAFPLLAPASVAVPVAFHVVSDHRLTPAERAGEGRRIAAQMKVMNDSYGGRTGTGVATPFRFTLQSTDYTVAPAWARQSSHRGSSATPEEQAMKSALHTGDARTLNVYAADLRGGVLGWGYLPRRGRSGADPLDGVVIVDGSMPGGPLTGYNRGYTLVHEAGHWLGLLHTFEGGCGTSNDFVDDTPAEAHPQYGGVASGGCDAAPLDPIHNFMDYADDECMNTFTPDQAKRMSDTWQSYRAVRHA